MASFLLNHNVNPRLGRLLRVRGHATVTAREAHLDTATDRELLLFAGGAGLILLTDDEDFAQLHCGAIIAHAGILFVAPIHSEPLANRLLRLTASGEWVEE